MAGLFNFKNTNFIPSLLIALSFIIGFLNLLNSTIYNLLLMVLCAIGSLILISIRDNKRFQPLLVKKILIIDIVAWFLIVFFAIVQSGENPMRLATLAYLLYSTIIAYICSSHNVNVFILKISYYIIATYLIVQCLVVGLLPDEILQFSAGGMMPSVLLCISITIQYLDYKQNARINIIPPATILVIATYSISRTALICALIYMLITVIMISYCINNKLCRLLLFTGIIFLLTHYTLLYWDDIMTLDMYNKFEHMGVDSSARDVIWKEYFKSLGLSGFFIGHNVDNMHMIAGFGNTHNSLIQMHSQLGIFSLVFIFYLIKISLFYVKHNIYLFMLLLILLTRGMFDSLFFFNIFDYAVFVFMFCFRNNGSISRENLKIGII